MFSIRFFKKNGRGALKKNYFMALVACLFVSILMGTFHNPFDIVQNNIMPYISSQEIPQIDEARQTMSMITVPDSASVLNEFLKNVGAGNSSSKHWTAGVLSIFANATEGAGNVVTGVLNVIDKFVFKDKIASGIVVIVGTVISAVLYIFVVEVMLVGLYRFMLESRRYRKTQISRILFPWTVKKGRHTAWVMLVRKVYWALWCFTIVGGVIKYYSYRMVPFIMAENPNLSARDAINLSRKMMDGYKWKTFLFDLSFIGWYILGFITLSLTDIFFTRPYKYTAEAELYMALRQRVKENSVENSDKLCDDLLSGREGVDIYPVHEYMIEPIPTRKWITSDYKRDYSVTSLILMFFTFSIIGWVWEVIVFLFSEGEFINRGTTYGPWLPIYGFGGLIILVVLKRLRDKPLLLFIVTALVCGTLEYFTGWFLETVTTHKYWDYTGYFLNIQGRVCLEGLLVFGIAGLAATYLIAPALDDLYKKIPQRVKIALCVALITLFVADNIVAGFFMPHVGKGITEYKTQ